MRTRKNPEFNIVEPSKETLDGIVGLTKTMAHFMTLSQLHELEECITFTIWDKTPLNKTGDTPDEDNEETDC